MPRMGVRTAEEQLIRAQSMLKRFVIAVLFGAMLIRAGLIITDWNFGDVSAYWAAAERLKHGEPLYLASLSPDSYQVFRYAPWFAWLWVPLTFLPRTLVEVSWALLLALASGWILVALLRLRSAAAVGLALTITPWLLSLVQVGNVQPLVVAALAFGMRGRSGPLWVGATAALKVVPGLFALVYVARRDWRRTLLAVGWTVILAAPFLLYDLAGYQTDPGRSYSLYYYVSPFAWVIGAGAAVAVALFLAWRRSRYIWLAAAIAVMLAAPRTHVTYATYLVVAALNADVARG